MIEGILFLGIIAFLLHIVDCVLFMRKSSALSTLRGQDLSSGVKKISSKLSLILRFALVERDSTQYLRTQLMDTERVEISPILSRDVRRMLPLFLLGLGLLLGPTEQIEALGEMTRPIVLGMSLFSFLLQGYSERKYDTALQTWLSNVYAEFPILPEGMGGTKDVLQELTTHYKELQEFNQKMVQRMEKSQKILSNLSQDLQHSFKRSVDEQLAPSLEEITKLASQSQTNYRRFVEESGQKQNQAVQAMIAQVMQGIDQAIGQNLRDTSESFATSVQRQQVSMDRWRRSIDSVSTVISSLEGATRAVTLGAEKMAKAAEPVEIAAKVFAEAAEQLERSLPAIADVANIYQNSQEMLEGSHKAIADGTQEYKEIAGTIGIMVQGLQKAHEASIETIAKGVDQAILGSLQTAGEQLTAVQKAQIESLDKWNNVSGQLNLTMKDMQETSKGLSSVSKELLNASEPTVQASKYFYDASKQLQESIQPLRETVQMHEAGKEALEVVVIALREESTRYGASAKVVHSIVEQLETTQGDILLRIQGQLDHAISDNLVQASKTLEESLSRSSSEMTTSLGEARKQLTDTISDTINQFEHAISSASVSLIDNWGETGRTIQEAMEHSSQVLDQSVQEVGKKLNQRVDDAGRSLEMSAQLSAKSIREGAQEAKNLLSNVGGDWSESIKSASASLKDSAGEAGGILLQSFEKVEQQLEGTIGDVGKEMAKNLKEVHNDFTESLEYSTKNLRELADLQSGHTEGWQELLDNLKPALSNLKSSTQDLNEVMHGLRGSVEPVKEASLNFKEASKNIVAVFPNITDTAKSYQNFNQALMAATQSLSSTAVQYVDAGQNMAEILSNVQKGLGQQDRSNSVINKTLVQAEQTIRSLEPVTIAIRQAAGDIKEISSQTTNTVDTIQKAASAQNQTVQQMGKLSAQLLKTIGMQSNRLNQVTEQMSLLQDVLTHGVQAFAKTLPKSVDQTLVNFDQVLGEGVARLGITIERLREAMDDLIEELEMRK